MEKENNIRIYEVVEDESEVFKISLVEEPAIEASMVYFAKQRPEFVTFESDERHMIFAPVLRPDFPIYRRRDWNGEECYIRFSKKSVERLAHDYLRNGYQWNWSTDHEKDVPEMTLVESWIKMSENDKSVTLGLDPNLEIGTWFVGVYVNNVEVWERVKSGDFGGLSIEGLLRLDELVFSKHKITDKDNEKMTKDEMNNETFLEKIKQIVVEALNLNKADEQVEEEVKLEETPAEEQAEEKVELEETPVEETPEEEPKDEEKEAMRAKIDELNAVIDELNAKVAELTGQVEKLSKQPSTKEIKASAATQKQNPFEVIKQLRDGTYFSNGK